MAADAVMPADALNRVISFNSTAPIGNPTASWRHLRGKYSRIFSAEGRPIVESWYNTYATAEQRQHFKRLVREIHEMATIDRRDFNPASMIMAKALINQHGGELIADGWRHHTTAWAATAPPAALQQWRTTFGRIGPVSLFGGKSHMRTTHTADGVKNTAEHVYRRRGESAKRRIQMEKFARLKGEPPPPPPPPSTHSIAGSDGQSTAMLASQMSASSPRTRTPRGIVARRLAAADRVREPPGRGTTYDSFYCTSNYKESAARKGYLERNEQDKEREIKFRTLVGNAPWETVPGIAFKERQCGHGREHYPDHNAAWVQGGHQNYNDNYNALLARRWRRSQRSRLRNMIAESRKQQYADDEQHDGQWAVEDALEDAAAAAL